MTRDAEGIFLSDDPKIRTSLRICPCRRTPGRRPNRDRLRQKASAAFKRKRPEIRWMRFSPRWPLIWIISFRKSARRYSGRWPAWKSLPGWKRNFGRWRQTRREAFFGNRRRMRAVSAVCALFLVFAAGAGILASPQSEHLRSELYALLSGSDDTGDSMNSDAMDSRVSEDGDDENSDRPGRGDEMSEGTDTHAQDKSGETIYREGTAEKNSPSASPVR